MKSLISVESSSWGINISKVSASVGGEIRALTTGIAGAVAIRRPAVVKTMDITQNETKRLNFEGREIAIALDGAKTQLSE